MRLEILNRGYRWQQKLLFGVVRLVFRSPLPDAAKIVMFRPAFYGTAISAFTQLAMRGPSTWSVAERELMAAYVSRLNQCAFCIGAHTATSTAALGDPDTVAAVLDDLDTAPIDERLRATLRMLGKLTREHTLDAGDVRAALASGVLADQIREALAVSFAFNATNRLADAFGFEVLSPEAAARGARFLLRRGYG